MPELPEVQALAENLASRLRGRRIVAFTVPSIAALKTYDPPVSALAGREVTGVQRHGKFLDIEASDAATGGAPLHLVAHLSRAGWVRWREKASDTPLAQRGPLAARLRFEDGAALDITEMGTEKRLALWVVGSPEEVVPLAALGVDPLGPDFTTDRLSALVGDTSATLKTALTTQSLIAGVGNAYSDEALHRARLSPYKRADKLDPAEVARLHDALRDVLGEAVQRSVGLEPSELKGDKKQGLQVHGRTGQPCPVCGDTIRQVSFATRSLQYCPACQTGGKALADRRLSRLLK
jgi:formamidopyrimidine-DNA glycosylase